MVPRIPSSQSLDHLINEKDNVDPYIARGYIGPRRTPTSETATPPPINEGTSHTTSSRLEDMS